MCGILSSTIVARWEHWLRQPGKDIWLGSAIEPWEFEGQGKCQDNNNKNKHYKNKTPCTPLCSSPNYHTVMNEIKMTLKCDNKILIQQCGIVIYWFIHVTKYFMFCYHLCFIFQNMISSFRASELQVPQGFVETNQSGHTSELLRVFHMLERDDSSVVKHKIKELYRRRSPIELNRKRHCYRVPPFRPRSIHRCSRVNQCFMIESPRQTCSSQHSSCLLSTQTSRWSRSHFTMCWMFWLNHQV